MALRPTQRYMDSRHLQEEAAKYGCTVETYHPRRKIFTLRKGERWTYLYHPVTGKPIQRMREVGVDVWKEAICKSAEYLTSNRYREMTD